MKVTAKVERVGGWWAVEVDYAGGLHTQAKRLDQVPEMVKDAVSLVADVPAKDVEVSIEAALPEKVRSDLAHARELMAKAQRVQREASAATRLVVHELRDEERLSVRDVGCLLDVSPQRVSQLVKNGS
jgi:DNA-directed RNA polymerase specialized sigma subunit